MRDLLDRRKRDPGDDWHEKLAREMLAEDREKLAEALKRLRSSPGISND